MEMRGLKLTQVTAVKEYYPVATHGDAWIETHAGYCRQGILSCRNSWRCVD